MRAQLVSSAHGPQHMLYGAEHNEAEEDANQAIADNSGAERRPKALEDGFIKGQADLISTVGNAWSAEVHPRGDGGASAEDQPEASNRLYVGKQVHQGDQTHQTADGGTAEAEGSFLVAGTDRRQRDHEAGDYRSIDARVVEADEEHVAD